MHPTRTPANTTKTPSSGREGSTILGRRCPPARDASSAVTARTHPPRDGCTRRAPARPAVDAATERHDAELAELADATKAELQRVVVEYESAADARRNDATERHESRLAELADETSAELSRVAAQFERALDARRDDAERHEVKLAELADTTRAELSRIAARFERVATDRIAQVEELTARAAAQAQEISERMAGLDQREAEFDAPDGGRARTSRFAVRCLARRADAAPQSARRLARERHQATHRADQPGR